MDVIGQSKTVQQAPYFHLAYLAASHNYPQKSMMNFGWMALLIGFLLFFRLVPTKSDASIRRRIGLNKKPLTIFIALIMIVGSVVLIIAARNIYNTEIFIAPDRMKHVGIHLLGQNISRYAETHEGQLTPVDQWCDELVMIEGNDLTFFHDPELMVRSYESDMKASIFSMNRYAVGELEKFPEDMVLLFESSQGWNQSGDAELLKTKGEKGCYVLFVNMKVESVKPDQFHSLKWKPD